MIGVKELLYTHSSKTTKQKTFFFFLKTQSLSKMCKNFRRKNNKNFFWIDLMKKHARIFFLRKNTFHLTTPHNRMRKCH